MKHTSVFVIALAILLMPLTACGRTHVRSSNHYVTQPVTKTLGDFTHIEVAGSVDVDFTMGATQEISLYGADNVIQYIKLDVNNGVLTVSLEDNVSVIGDAELTVLVTAPKLNSALITGSGDIEIRNLTTDAFDIEVMGSGDVDVNYIACTNVKASVGGSGDIELQGNAERAEYIIMGSGDIDAENFRVKDVVAENHGSGDIDCYAENSLKANAQGSGSITYKGTPRQLETQGRTSRIGRDD